VARQPQCPLSPFLLPVWGSAQMPRKRIASCPVLPYVSQVITYEWRGLFGNTAINALHAEGFSHEMLEDD
jgi:hypothetical protein